MYTVESQLIKKQTPSEPSLEAGDSPAPRRTSRTVACLGGIGLRAHGDPGHVLPIMVGPVVLFEERRIEQHK